MNLDRAIAARGAARLVRFRAPLALVAAAVLVAACTGGNRYAAPGCVATHDGKCLLPEVYQERASALAAELRTQPNFPAQWGLATINAHEAYAHLALAEGEAVAPGAGQTIGVLDSGIDLDNPAFVGKTVTEEFLLGAEDEIGDDSSHGTAVASIIAGIRIPSVFHFPHGVAWGADLAVFALPLGRAGEYFRPISLEGLKGQEAEDAALYGEILAWEDEDGQRLDFLNLSLGFSGLIDIYGEEDLRANYAKAIEVYAQGDADEKTIFIWAAGNSHGRKCDQDAFYCVDVTDGEGTVDAASPSILAGLSKHFEDLRGHHLAVVAIKPDGEIADFSNRCGGADWCLAAPGDDVLYAYFGPLFGEPGFRGVFPGGGTSFAAPMVTGGLALMKQLFRDQLSNTDLAARMLETADRTGRFADAAIYGRGLLDLGAATSPVGATEIAMAATVNGEGASLATSGLVSGGALGDGLSRSLAGQEIAAFDSLGAPFWFDLGDFASVRDARSTSDRLRDFMAPTTGPHGLGARAVVSLRQEHGTWVPGSEDPSGL